MEGPIVEALYDGKSRLGEGPIYDRVTGELIWVDIWQQTVNFLNVETKQNRSLTLPSTVGAAIPVEGSSDQLVVMVGKKICLMNRHTGDLRELVEVDQDKPHHGFNDAKCDSSGRLWAGTMDYNRQAAIHEKEPGSLFSYSHGVLMEQLSGVAMSNGMGWSPDESTMYYVDTGLSKVFAFDYSGKGEGEIKNQRVVVDYTPDQDRMASPDGMTVDIDGKLWVASFFGRNVTCWDPTGQKLREVTIPAHACTSCCFGGPNYDLLFVTSGSEFITEKEWEEFPHSGAIFVVKNLGIRGKPDNYFRL